MDLISESKKVAAQYVSRKDALAAAHKYLLDHFNRLKRESYSVTNSVDARFYDSKIKEVKAEIKRLYSEYKELSRDGGGPWFEQSKYNRSSDVL